MHIPRFWANSTQSVQLPDDDIRYFLSVWQWSEIGIAEAQARAILRLAEIVRKVQGGETLDQYGYGDGRPLREEVTQTLQDRAGRESAVVTRNAYGALVLNTAQAMFIDIDFEDGPVSLPQLLGGRKPPVTPQEDRHRQQVIAWQARHPELSLKVYRTFGGLRCLVTNQVFDPGQAAVATMLQELGSDRLYIRLCRAQACFRARLTPKPWRCGLKRPPARYPWESAAAEARSRQWEQLYAAVSEQYAVCRLVDQIGPAEVHPDLADIVALHDQATGTALQKPLA